MRPIFNSLPVYCCCCLANISIPGIGVVVPEFRPFFYVNVADISALENELSYVACKCELRMFFSYWKRTLPVKSLTLSLALRYYWEDLRGEEGSVRCVCRQSECKDLQGRFKATAPLKHRGQGEVPQTHWTKVRHALKTAQLVFMKRKSRPLL